ncbi:hypothetical protein JB92DRAFT_2698718 [Gautieria morchelliformis]|nr:hypothetical protein JB92DRAFT_2698718 [Gautieria morchelliformis]
MVSWLWGLVWGDDSTVTVVDRTPVLNFNARPAAFGPASDVLGYLIRVEDFSVPCDEDGDDAAPNGTAKWHREEVKARHGCPRLCVRGKDKPESSETWMALVMRGGCTFVEKVREAQRFGAKGVVVGGETKAQDQHGDGLVQMFSLGDSSDIRIPSTYITHDSYTSLSTHIGTSNTSIFGLRTVSVGIVTDTSGWEWYSPLLTFLILLFLPSSLTLCTLLVHRVRAARAAQRERAPEDVVQNLPWRVWEGQQTLWELEKTIESIHSDDDSNSSRDDAVSESRGDGTAQAARKWYETQVECAICLEDFIKGDKVRVLPCRHIFHMDEIDDWLIRRKKLCPICKHDVTRPPFSSSGSDLATPPGSQPMHHGAELPTEPTERTPLLQRSDGL